LLRSLPSLIKSLFPDFSNFRIENVTSSPVLLQQCSTWAGWDVPSCADYPSTGFTFENITWHNFTGYLGEKVGNTSISLACSPHATCTNFSFTDINVATFSGANATVGKCTNVDGYDSACNKI
jgi:galacturan 1,4-alpha-galacturonidase